MTVSNERSALLLAVASLVITTSSVAPAQVIDNGLEPPTPLNVIEASDGPSFVEIHNQDCAMVVPPDLPCEGLGPTTVQIVVGGVAARVEVWDGSRFEIDGGIVNELELNHTARLEMTEGLIGVDSPPGAYPTLVPVEFHDSSTALIIGGDVNPVIRLHGDSRLTLAGGTVGGFFRQASSEEECIQLEEITGPTVQVYDSAEFEVQAGLVDGWVLVCDAGTYIQTGGQVGAAEDAVLRDRPGVTVSGAGVSGWISGGFIRGGVAAYRGSTLVLSGGRVEQFAAAVGESSEVLVEGGTVWGLQAGGDGVVTVERGIVNGPRWAGNRGRVTINGGSLLGYGGRSYLPHFQTFGSGVVELYGEEFTLDGEPVPFGSLSDTYGDLSGRLAGGERFVDHWVTPGENVQLIQAAPTFDLYDAGRVKLSTPQGEVVVRGTASVDVDATRVRYLEYDGDARGKIWNSQIEGSLVVFGKSTVKLKNSSVAGDLVARGGAKVAAKGGSIGFSLDVAGNARVDLASSSLPQYVEAAGDGRLSLKGVGSSDAILRVTASDRAVVRLGWLRATEIQLFDESIAVIGSGASVGEVFTLDGGSVDVLGGRVQYVSVRGPGHFLLDGGYVGSLRGGNNVDIRIREGVLEGSVPSGPTGSLDISGGEVTGGVRAKGTVRASIRGGLIRGAVEARDSVRFEIDGGVIEGPLLAHGADALITLRGGDFAVDGVPVAYGVVPVAVGRLTGTLVSGEQIDTLFEHRGHLRKGTILLPEPSAVSPQAIASILLMMTLFDTRRRRALKVSSHRRQTARV